MFFTYKIYPESNGFSSPPCRHPSSHAWIITGASDWPPCLYPCPHCMCLHCGIKQDHSKAKCNHVTPLLKPCDGFIYHSVKVHILIRSETSKHHHSHSGDFSTSSPSTSPFPLFSLHSLSTFGGTGTLYFRTSSWLFSVC